MGRPHDGHRWVRRMMRMRAASRRSTIPPNVRRHALPSPQAATERQSTRLPDPAGHNRARMASARDAASPLHRSCGAHARSDRGARALARSARPVASDLEHVQLFQRRLVAELDAPSPHLGSYLPCTTPRRHANPQKITRPPAGTPLALLGVMDLVHLALRARPLLQPRGPIVVICLVGGR